MRTMPRMRSFPAFIVAFFLVSVLASAQDLPAGTEVLVLDAGAKLQSATIVEKIPDGYKVKLPEGDLVMALQSDLALDREVETAVLKPGVPVAARLYGEYYTGKIAEVGENDCLVAWDGGGADSVPFSDIRLMLPARSDPRPAPAPGIAGGASGASTAAASSGKAATGTVRPQSGSNAAQTSVVPEPEEGTPGSVLMDILGEAANSYAWAISMKGPTASKTLKFSDAAIAVEFVPMDEKQLVGPYTWSFWITNKGSQSIAIDWDKCYMTSLKGTRRPTYHGDMKAISTTAKQGTTNIAAKARIGDALTPKDSVTIIHHKGEYNERGEWVDAWDQIDGYQVFFGEDFGAAEGYDQVKAAVVGKEFKVGLAFVIGGSPKSYEFTFRIDDIVKTKGQGFTFGQ